MIINNAFAVYPDSVRLGLSGKNSCVAVFKFEKQAKTFGRLLYGSYFEIKPIYSVDFIT